jgi:hypothetical protein
MADSFQFSFVIVKLFGSFTVFGLKAFNTNFDRTGHHGYALLIGLFEDNEKLPMQQGV